MKALIAVSAALFLVVAGLSAVPLSPVEAECPGTNQIFLTDSDESTDGEGNFSYTLSVGWALTFDPFLLQLSLASTGHTNIDQNSVEFTPNDVTLSVECVSEEDIPIEVTGELIHDCSIGGVNVKVFMTAGFPYNATSFKHTTVPAGC